jgi:hypothetical protein
MTRENWSSMCEAQAASGWLGWLGRGRLGAALSEVRTFMAMG